MVKKLKIVHGDDLLYRFLTELFAEESEHLREAQRMMLISMGVWFPADAYRRWPVMIPWVVRDPKCRKGPNGDEWASPDVQGYMRDDNSMIKGLPRSFPIKAPRQPHLNGARMGTEFVAAHVWRICSDGGPLASRRPLTNSFIPNLVWLPKQIAKLTDKEGSSVQRILQSLSWAMYRHSPVQHDLVDVTEEAWSLLPPPDEVPTTDLWPLVNRFVVGENWFTTRQARVELVLNALEELSKGKPLEKKVISTRYTTGLPGVAAPARHELAEFLARFRP